VEHGNKLIECEIPEYDKIGYTQFTLNEFFIQSKSCGIKKASVDPDGEAVEPGAYEEARAFCSGFRKWAFPHFSRS
jgi:hypothetical protein